ncbi:LOW QUALITY PROTEIN: E3 ubiquitin-protein ligase CHIP-like [Aristolochia californica]|uniref:LOW QUALITY PROTEIN: E3 ubiquitin-protein ligase CHIP-like n=1 Tax=Aristolochia californica TaxID=171875 RepID=UPI0035DCD292
MAPAVATAKQQAELLKRDGNTCFGKERFGAAIEAYTEAITLCPNVAVYWTNRALCFRKRNEWTRVEEDCRKAIKLDSNSVKGHYMLGLALLQREEYAEGVKKLEKALDLGRGANPKGYMVEEIWQELSKAKYLTWEHSSSQRVWKLQTLKEECEKALEEKISSDVSLQTIGEGSDICSIVGFREQKKLLLQVFSKASEADIPTEVPDHLCCRITFEIFRDPVITPSGFTYERAALLGHLQKVGNFEPITREPLDEQKLVSNLAIKEAVQAYLNEHGWAYRL